MKSAVIKKKKAAAPKKSKVHSKEKSFPIVAIGASAGGLEAMSVLLRNLPSDTGMAFIYVQHLSPDHKSFLTSILSKITKMKVQEIENMEHILPNNVYVIPHNKAIEVTDGHIQLLPRITNLSIDVLFSSLAETHKENVIGIILSGYASDGMMGLKAIKNAGGITFAQDDTAQAGSMPKSAIAVGAVDFILPPKEIARYLVRLSKNGFIRPHGKGTQNESVLGDINPDLKSIFEILHKKTGVDFSHYKMATIRRRLNHKMLQGGVNSIKEYEKLLLKKSTEVDILYKDLLINVTSFFRDPEVFKYLKTILLPKLLKSKTQDETLRIWIPACSTGEEAYSIAMLIAELQDKKTRKVPVQIFATDLSEQVIRDARIGEYSQSDVKDIPKKYKDRFFTKMGDNYQIAKELREICVFAPHNILRDPPFSRMDFISCRNLLIYFDAVAQKRVFATLHFTLNEGGYLLLGKAETIGTPSQLFTQINNKLKIYSRKKNTGIRKIPELTPHFPGANFSNKKTSFPVKSINTNPTGIENAIDTALLTHYMPACAVVNKDMEVLQFRGPVSLFLGHSPGKASLNILKMAKPEFAFELRNAIQKSIKTKQPVYKPGIEIKIETVLRMMSLDVSPLKIEWDEPLLLIVFTLQEQVEKPDENNSRKNNSTEKDRRIKKLAEELNKTRAEISSIIEAQELTNEELQAANEEVVSSNEEFQTLNEELETSKEEIEATNEELHSTNQNLQIRNDLLTESHEYSEAIMAAIHEPMLILNRDFRVKSANKSFYKKFLVKKGETEGESLFELGNKQWNIAKLRKVLNDIISKNSSFENFEVTHTFPGIGEKIMLLNAHLIIQKIHSEQLILLAIADVSDVRKLALELKVKEAKVFQIEEKEKRAAELIIANKELVFQNNEKEKRAAELIIANKELLFQNKEKEKRAAELIIANKELAFQNKEKEKRAVELIIANKELAFQNEEKEKRASELFTANKELIFQTGEKEKRAAELAIADIELEFQNKEKEKREIANKELEAYNFSIKAASQYSRSLIEASLDPLVTINAEGKITDVNEASIKVTGIRREKLIGTDFSNYFTEPEKAQAGYRQVFDKGFVSDYALTIKHKNGNLTDVLYNASVYKDDNGSVLGVFAAARDVTDRNRIEKEFLEAKLFAEQATEIAEDAKLKAESLTLIAEDAVKAKQQFLSNMSHEIRTPMNAIIGFTKVVLKTDLTVKQKEYLAAIKVSGDALIVLINDILDLAKVDSGKMTFEKTPFKMASSIEAMLNIFETKIKEKNLELVKKYDSKIPEVLVGDPMRLHQIILNLVSNAVKFTTTGKITVSVYLLNEDEENVNIGFAVTDTGIGIPENKIASIFENFQQASSDTSRLYGGTGLGLAIVKQLVEAQGGTINVKSKMGEGAAFSFILSFQKSVAEAEIEIGIVDLDAEIKNIKVLVVEDIALNQLLMKTLLDEFGFERDIASNGKMAIEKLQTKSYDIILMDLQMPVMNGFEATDYIRNTLKSKIPIIALTADVTTVDLAKCKAVGMTDYIAKPIDERLLYSKIVGILKKPAVIAQLKENPDNQIKKSKCTDLSYLRQRTKSNPKLLREMISLYLEQTPSLINSIKQSLLNKDWDSMHAAAHKMIPSFSIVGMSIDFENTAKKIHEYSISKEHKSELPALILQLGNICAQACAELEEEFDTLKNY